MRGEKSGSSEFTVTPKAADNKKRFLWLGLVIVLVVVGIVFAFAFHSLSETKKNMEADILQRQQAITSARVEMTDAWLESLVEKSSRIVGSDLFEIFASEIDKLPDGVPLLFSGPGTSNEQIPENNDRAGRDGQAEQLSSQLPLMRTMLSEFVSFSGFVSARIVNSRAETYMSTEATYPPLSSVQKKLALQVVQNARRIYAPLEIHPKGITLDIYLPILPPSYQGTTSKPVAVMILSQLVDSKLSEVLSPGLMDEKGRKLKMVQKNGEIFQNVASGATMLRQVTDFPVDKEISLPFKLRTAYGENLNVYSSGIRLRSTDWWIVAENEASLTQNTLDKQAKIIYSIAGLIAIAMVLLVFAGWWRIVGREQSYINTQISGLLSVIDEQKKLLDGINSAITDPISLSDGKGIYRYVNDAFANVVGRTVDDVIGLDGPAIFGFDTAKRLNASDHHVLMTGENLSITEILWLQSKRYHFQISKTPLKDANSRTVQGIVSVFRDITQLVETEERSRRVVQQTIDALVRTIEESDPFLGGHSRIMGGIASLIAKQLRLSEKDRATIEAAANLSQIGKMFVPREILLKPGVLTPEEKTEMERHVEYTRNVLKDIEFDLPVVESICQMNERLDGKGYPKGLVGDEISILAKVLAVANAFTAMAKPRSYRPALPVDESLNILERHTGNYDPEVVKTLRQVLNTPAGERLVAQAAAAKAI
ncbi:MAG: PAS domain-containing protein [Desulfovibrio sp.]|jgi:PAS domain S-box-containing protein|nr:PAS domain-containing protein [Desulfovibrio sp.]